MKIQIEIIGRKAIISTEKGESEHKTVFIKKLSVNDLIELVKDNKI